jgi:hypothetical protein
VYARGGVHHCGSHTVIAEIAEGAEDAEKKL